ncbi:DUF3224 domain-containing protein [Rheinheimera soli]|uniref:Jacalin-type lectin domain-containing protein n=1 Tax=Rheinheimera soli TaxID=443616 RepID=A0ABU1VZC3_9GAMM|nr:DUF3224 domain-containing protein [Rheinheimera soli]MDR7121072.1 hypothetical protein [Rheinheimera soli]
MILLNHFYSARQEQKVKQLKGSFQITDWKESINKSFDDGAKLSKALVSQTYSGDITGSSEVQYQLSYETTGDACFNGFEFISGTIGDTPCKLTLKHDGTFEKGIAKSQFGIVSSATHPEWVGVTGFFTSTEGGQANYLIG